MDSHHQVIDVNGALEQCGDDPEFLKELLDDLNDELRTQIDKIAQEFTEVDGATVIKRGEESMVVVQRAAHVIKGAAANLMCFDLQCCSANLEAAVKARSVETFYGLYVGLECAVGRFQEFVKSQSLNL